LEERAVNDEDIFDELGCYLESDYAHTHGSIASLTSKVLILFKMPNPYRT
jgi:hypothetical protein